MYTVGLYEEQKAKYQETFAKYQHLQTVYSQHEQWIQILRNAEYEHGLMFAEKKAEFEQNEAKLQQYLKDINAGIEIQQVQLEEAAAELKKQEMEGIFTEINLAILKQVTEEEREQIRQIEDLRGQYQKEYIAKIQAEHKKEAEICKEMNNSVIAILVGARELDNDIRNLDVRESHNTRVRQDIKLIEQQYANLQVQRKNLPNLNSTLRLKHISKDVVNLMQLKYGEVEKVLRDLAVRVHITPVLNRTCDICGNPMFSDNMANFACDDVCCRECAIRLVKTGLQEKTVPCNCPTGKHKVDPTDVQLLLQGPDYDEYNRLYTLSMNPVSVDCPVPKCEGLGGFVGTLDDLKDLPENDKKVLCFQCGSFFCPFCKIPFHFGQTCASYQDWAEKNKNADHLTQAAIQQELATGAMKKCPTCALLSTKPTGCAYVVCPGCKVPWCFATGKKKTECGGGHGCH